MVQNESLYGLGRFTKKKAMEFIIIPSTTKMSILSSQAIIAFAAGSINILHIYSMLRDAVSSVKPGQLEFTEFLLQKKWYILESPTKLPMGPRTNNPKIHVPSAFFTPFKRLSCV